MQLDELNNALRDMYNGLVDSGFKKFPMAEVTLGKAFSPQFNKFLEDTDLGINPLIRMINGLGYELHIIPVKSDDNEFKKIMNEHYTSFFDMSKNDLIDHIENRKFTRSGSSKTVKVFETVIDDLLNDLE